jgi:hypothetical protein
MLMIGLHLIKDPLGRKAGPQALIDKKRFGNPALFCHVCLAVKEVCKRFGFKSGIAGRKFAPLRTGDAGAGSWLVSARAR